MNFGPLNQTGGERRLNVAVTRAREELIVFGSLRPENIDLSRTSAIGVAHLKQFLDFAIHGARAFAMVSTGPLGDFESPFEAAVSERLAGKGWILHPQIGVSGFRIDLGVVDPDAPGAFLAGVECDGATYHRGATARDRDRLRQVVLEGLGWRILRIWSTDWWTNAARETDRLHMLLQAALMEARARRHAGQQPVVDDAIIEIDDIEPESSTGAWPPPPTEAAVANPRIEEATTYPAQFYDDDYRTTLAIMVASELDKAGPLREDRLIQRIARLHGFQRVGREIRERVLASIPQACRRTRDSAGPFVWPTNSDPSACETFRTPQEGESRDSTEVPIEELSALAKACLLESHDDDAVLLAMRDACGLSNLREASRERFKDAIAMVLKQGLAPL